MQTLPRAPLAATLLLLAACGTGSDSPAQEAVCTIAQPLAPLPLELSESSGAAAGPQGSEIVWTHNDSGGETTLFAVRTTGQLVASFPVTGAGNRDWEDVTAGPCAGGHCVFIADVGDNEAKREDVSIYRIPEPEPTAPATVAAERFRARYPRGARDTESIFVLPSGELYLLTKGRTSPLELYRYPGTLRAGETAQLELVAAFGRDRLALPEQVTGADASPDGQWIAIRTYQTLRIHPADAFLRGDAAGARVVDLSALGEPQGEAVTWLDSSRLALTSEGVGKDQPGYIAVLACPGL